MDENMEDITDKSGEWLNSVYSSDNDDDSFGDRQLDPRVGEEYQVEIPELMTGYEGLQLKRKLTDLKSTTDFPNCLTVGLPIPIMWVHLKKESPEVHGNQDSAVNISGSLELESSQESQITSSDEEVQLRSEPLSSEVDCAEEVGHPLPGSATDTWKDIEYDSFVLGLYTFGKNLCLVNKFVESKKMGDILSYYYGKFYRSAEYLRWSKSRKKKSKQHAQGQWIFTGWRQNELLSRISSHVSEDCKNLLTEVSRRFGEGKGKLSLEDYVFTLKDMVGVSVLIEAVAIGKGEQDLTGTAANDPPKTKARHVLPTRPEIPGGKACSSLTKGEIIRSLTGDIRLSKARSSDLFWEAVWPRLLARGWQSEQPRGQSHASSRSSLVFLVPGVKRFSRRKFVKGKLMKGTHFFDSITDVLNKVAAEPEHLDLGSDGAQVSADKEESSSDPDVLPNRKRHSYLQPHNSNCNQGSLKFTIVDSSFVCGGKRVKFRDLKSLPVDTLNALTPSALSSETERDAKRVSPNEKEVNNTSKYIENRIMERGTLADSAVENPEDQRSGLPNDRQSRKTLKVFMYSRRGKSQKSTNLDVVSKQNEFGACQDKQALPENTQSQILTDLNPPQVLPESGTNGSVLKTSDGPKLLNSSNNEAVVEQEQPITINGRRQSTRNRAMTTRALEALEFEFGTSKKKRKGVDPMSKNIPRQVHGKTDDVTTSHSDVAGEVVAYSEVEKMVDGNTNMAEEFSE